MNLAEFYRLGPLGTIADIKLEGAQVTLFIAKSLLIWMSDALEVLEGVGVILGGP